MTTRLLIIDALDLSAKAADGRVWSTAEWFRSSLSGVRGCQMILASAARKDLCRLAQFSDGVILGGSDRSACEDNAFTDQLLDVIAVCRHGQIPFLGICYGGQLLGRALGGVVQRHPGGWELGCVEIRLSPDGAGHFLFQGLSENAFTAIATHGDAVLSLPESCLTLAWNNHTPIQAFESQGLFFGLQFHPEMDGQALRDLWAHWSERGEAPALSEAQQTALGSCECACRSRIIGNFARRIQLPMAGGGL